MTDSDIATARGPWTRVPDWWRAHPRLVDGALAVVLWLLTSVLITYAALLSGPPPPEAQAYPGLSEPVTIAVFFAVSSLQVLPLAWRRSRPELSFVLVVLGHLAQLVTEEAPIPSNVSALVSSYALAAHSESRRVRLLGLGVAAISGVLAVRTWAGYRDNSVSGQIMSVVFISGLALVCWFWGDLSRKRRELVARLTEQNAALRRDRDQRARIAAQDERTRIAREMHDIVAHSLSVVVVQADGASYTAEHSADFDREHAGRALTTIGTTAREALAETRRLVGVLRTAESEGSNPTDLEYTPTEVLADLPELVDRVAASGLDVTLSPLPDTSAVPRETGLAAYRIVQESLTNVLKHAGPGAHVTVALTAGPDLRLEVRDDGRGAAAQDDGHGHGIIGMRERAASVDGSITAGPAPGGGYLVTAALPLRQENA